jgi:hypothetical protein
MDQREENKDKNSGSQIGYYETLNENIERSISKIQKLDQIF